MGSKRTLADLDPADEEAVTEFKTQYQSADLLKKRRVESVPMDQLYSTIDRLNDNLEKLSDDPSCHPTLRVLLPTMKELLKTILGASKKSFSLSSLDPKLLKDMGLPLKDISREPSEWFKSTVATFRMHWNLSDEHANHTLIDIFLLEFFKVMKPKRLVVYPETKVSVTVLASGTHIYGSVDYALAVADEQTDKELLRQLTDGLSNYKPPYLCVLEAKRDETFSAGRPQLQGEMLATQQVNKALTPDGQFYMPEKDLSVVSDEVPEILGVLFHWLDGKLPTKTVDESGTYI